VITSSLLWNQRQQGCPSSIVSSLQLGHNHHQACYDFSMSLVADQAGDQPGHTKRLWEFMICKFHYNTTCSMMGVYAVGQHGQAIHYPVGLHLGSVVNTTLYQHCKWTSSFRTIKISLGSTLTVEKAPQIDTFCGCLWLLVSSLLF
jgi:hypothetical protein